MLKYTNNASVALTSGVQAADTTINVVSTATFPQGVNFGGGDFFYITLYNTLSKSIEICKVTGMTPVAFTVLRGQDGTLAADFDLIGTVVERRAVAADYRNFVQAEDLLDHENAADPHPQYATDTALATAIGDHVGAADPHPGYATDTALTSAITAHTQAADPHPGYATDSDVTTAIGNHVAAANPHSQYATNTYVNDQVAQHEAKTNPHPIYTKAATNSDITAKTSAVLAITPSGLDHMWNRQAIERGVTISQGAPSTGKFPLLDETGKLDLSVVPTTGGVTYRGTVDAVNNPPPSLIYYAGDFFYHVGTTDIIDPNWSGIVGETVKTGDELIWTGTEWSLKPSVDDSSLYLFRDGTNVMLGDLQMNGFEMQSGVIDGLNNAMQIWRTAVPNTMPPGGTLTAGETWLNYPDRQLGYIDTNTDPVPLLPVRFWTDDTSYAAGDIVFYVNALYRCTTATTPGLGFVPSQWEDISSAAGDITVNSVAHGFDADDIGSPIYFNGTVWALSQAGTTAQHSNVISDVLSVDTFKIAAIGVVNVALPVSGGATLTPGTVYYVSAATAGQITATPPATTSAQFIVGRALTTSTMMLLATDQLAARKTYVDAQDTALDGRLTTAEGDIVALEGRMDTAEGDIVALEGRMDTAEGDIVALEGRMDTAESDINGLETNKADITYVDNQNTAQTAEILGLIIALG